VLGLASPDHFSVLAYLKYETLQMMTLGLFKTYVFNYTDYMLLQRSSRIKTRDKFIADIPNYVLRLLQSNVPGNLHKLPNVALFFKPLLEFLSQEIIQLTGHDFLHLFY
jgi:hypothetical protein